MGFQRPEGGWRYNFGGMKTNTAADEMPPTKYPYARNVRVVKSLQTRPGYDLLFATALDILTTCPLPTGEVGLAYSDTLEAIGGAEPYAWTIASGTLPGGLALAANGDITGTPTTVETQSFVIKVTDHTGTMQTKSCSMQIVAALAITTTCPLPDAVVDDPYSETFAASGGLAPLVWTITAGALPTGLSMDTSGNVTGTPTVEETASFTVQVRDALGVIHTLSCQLTVVPAAFSFADDFNRANGALGAPWSVISGGSGVQPQIVSNMFADSALMSAEVSTAPAGNKTGSSIVSWTGYTSIAFGGPMALRNTNGTNDNRYVLVASDVGGPEPRGVLRIMREFNGALTTLATAAPVNLVGGIFGNPLRLDWDVQPTFTRLTGFVNGVQFLTVDDMDGNQFTFGKPGISVVTSTGLTANSWDDYSCTSTP